MPSFTREQVQEQAREPGQEGLRGQNLRKPRRDRGQPKLELRRRGADRASRGAAPPRPPDAELLGHPAALTGVPMILYGDEMCRSQRGNNNAYCQDNELTWLDWSTSETCRQMLDFTRSLASGAAAWAPGARYPLQPRSLALLSAAGGLRG